MTGSGVEDSEELERIKEELWKMRRGAGIVGVDWEQYPTVRKRLGDSDPFEAMKYLVNDLGRSLQAHLLRRSLGYDSKGERNLTQRRAAFWAESDKDAPDNKTMDSYERMAITKLAQKLVHRRPPGAPEGSPER